MAGHRRGKGTDISGELQPLQPDPAFAGAALVVLGASQEQLLPSAVQAALADVSRPPDIDWVGTSVWNEAYVAALRGIASARRDARAASTTQAPREFNADWNNTYLNVCFAEAGTQQPDANILLYHMASGYVGDRLTRVRRAVQVANSMLLTPPEAVPSVRWARVGAEDRRAGLQQYVGDALQWFTISPPRPSEKTRLDRSPQIPNSFLVVLPTAAGKTKAAGDWLARQGVGPAARAPRVLWVTDQQKLVDDALNPDKTLQRCLPDGTRLTSVWEGHKSPEDASGDLVIITKNSVETELVPEDAVPGSPEAEQGALIDPKDFDIVVFDEADIMFSELKMRVIRRFDDAKKLFLTATPSRSTRRDLQRLMHHVRPVTLLEAAQQEIIAPVRILTFVARDPAHAEQLATFAALHLFIKEGKKAVVYCQPGGGSAQAVRVSEAVELHAPAVLGADYRPGQPYADMVGSVRNDSREVVNHFETDLETGVLTTCKKLQRGWDPKRMDGGIFIGPEGDFTELQQKIGRAFRLEPDNPDKVALIVQIKYAPVEGRTDYTAEMAFGFDRVMSGAFIGPGMNLKGAEGDAGGSGGNGGAGNGAERGNGSTSSADEALKKFLDGLPLELRQPLQPLGLPLSELVVAPGDRARYERPPGFDTTIDDILARYPGFRDWWFRDRLATYAYTDANGNEAVGVPSVRTASVLPEQAGTTRRYYHTATVEAFLAETDIPKTLAGESYSKLQLAEKLGVPPSLVVVAAREVGIVLEEKVRGELAGERLARPSWRYTTEQAVKIGDWIEAIPVAEETMVWLGELSRQYERYARAYLGRNNISAETRRHPPDSGLNGLGLYLDEATAQSLRGEHARIKKLMAETMPFRNVVKASGVAVRTVVDAMTPEERVWYDSSEMTFVEIGGESRRAAHHLPKDVAARLLERVSDNKLQPHEVSRRALAEWMGISEGRVRQILEGVPCGQKRIGSHGSQMAVYHISALGSMADAYRENGRGQTRGKDPAVLARLDAIDFSRLPQHGQDATTEQQEYARSIQLGELGLPADALAAVAAPKQPPKKAAPAQPQAAPAPAPEASSVVPPVTTPSPAAEPDSKPTAEAAPKPANDEPGDASAGDEPAAESAEPYVAGMAVEMPHEEPWPDGVGLEIVANLTGRHIRAVNNMVTQLGFDEDIRANTLSEAKANLLILGLRGGKKGRPAEPASGTAASRYRPAGVVQPMGSTGAIRVTTGEAASTDDLDPKHWHNVDTVMTDLRCSPAALTYLVAGDRQGGPRMRQTEDGMNQIHTTLLERIRATARRSPSSRDGWMTNVRLAQNLEIRPEEVPGWLRSHNVVVGQGEAYVARYAGRPVEYEVTYCERVWKLAMHSRRP